MLTSEYELYTASTNVIIFVISLVCFFKTKNSKMWKTFFLLVALAGFMGTIIHGITLNKTTIKILWAILSFIFSLIINLLLVIFIQNKKYTIKHVILLSLILYFIFFIEMLLKIDFLMSFVFYSMIILIILFYLCIKQKKHYFYLLGLIIQVIGGIFQFDDSFNIYYFDNNGIYHIALIITLILFYKANKKLASK